MSGEASEPGDPTPVCWCSSSGPRRAPLAGRSASSSSDVSRLCRRRSASALASDRPRLRPSNRGSAEPCGSTYVAGRRPSWTSGVPERGESGGCAGICGWSPPPLPRDIVTPMDWEQTTTRGEGGCTRARQKRTRVHQRRQGSRLHRWVPDDVRRLTSAQGTEREQRPTTRDRDI
jgi:hypothetical protein